MIRSIRYPCAISIGLFACIAILSGRSVAADASPGLLSFDADGNGAVDHAEFVSEMKARFEKIDSDRNGKVTRSELRGYGMKQMRSTSRDPLFARGRGRPEMPFDDDGEIGFAAFSKAMTRFGFDPVDANGDRILSAQEIKVEASR
jgi:hypothetical protein